MLTIIIVGVAIYLGVLIFTLALCGAAARGDRREED